MIKRKFKESFHCVDFFGFLKVHSVPNFYLKKNSLRY